MADSQNSNTASTGKCTLLQEILVPTFKTPVLILYRGQKHDADKTLNPEKILGKIIPVVQINETSIDPTKILEAYFDFRRTVPKGWIIIKENETNSIYHTIKPDSVNRIILVLIAPGKTSETYRPIKITGFICEQPTLAGDKMKIHWEFHNNYFDEVVEQAIPPNTTLATFKGICAYCGMGLSISPELDAIEDLDYRIVSGKSYYQFMQEIVEYSGEDNENAIDFWINPFGGVSLVDVKRQTSFADMVIESTYEIGYATYNEDVEPPTLLKTMKRFITDSPKMGTTNNRIKRINYVSTNNIPTTMGQNTRCYGNYKIAGECGSDTYGMEIYDYVNEGKSANAGNIADKSDPDYFKHKTFRLEYGGVEMGTKPRMKIKQERENFLYNIKCANIISVTMERPDFSMNRGEQVFVFITKTGLYEQLAGKPQNLNDPDKIINEAALMPEVNLHYSGFYYINGIEFYYNSHDMSLELTLHLVPINKFVTVSTMQYINVMGGDLFSGTTNLEL